MQEDEDLDVRERGRAWDGEQSDSDTEDHELPRRHQGVIASEAAFARLVHLHASCHVLYSVAFTSNCLELDYQWWSINCAILLLVRNSDIPCYSSQASYFHIGFFPSEP